MTHKTTIDPPNQAELHEDDWRMQLIPGCLFMSILPQHRLCVYSEVLPGKTPGADYVKTRSFCNRPPFQQTAFMHVSTVSMLLSKEQWDVARMDGWPSDDACVQKILAISPN